MGGDEVNMLAFALAAGSDRLYRRIFVHHYCFISIRALFSKLATTKSTLNIEREYHN